MQGIGLENPENPDRYAHLEMERGDTGDRARRARTQDR